MITKEFINETNEDFPLRLHELYNTALESGVFEFYLVLKFQDPDFSDYIDDSSQISQIWRSDQIGNIKLSLGPHLDYIFGVFSLKPPININYLISNIFSNTKCERCFFIMTAESNFAKGVEDILLYNYTRNIEYRAFFSGEPACFYEPALSYSNFVGQASLPHGVLETSTPMFQNFNFYDTNV